MLPPPPIPNGVQFAAIRVNSRLKKVLLLLLVWLTANCYLLIAEISITHLQNYLFSKSPHLYPAAARLDLNGNLALIASTNFPSAFTDTNSSGDLPILNDEVRWRDSLDPGGPVLCAGDHLGIAAHHRADSAQVGDILADSVRV